LEQENGENGKSLFQKKAFLVPKKALLVQPATRIDVFGTRKRKNGNSLFQKREFLVPKKALLVQPATRIAVFGTRKWGKYLDFYGKSKYSIKSFGIL